MELRFAPVLEAWPELAQGAWLTVQLSLVAMLIGVTIGVAGAAGKLWGANWLRFLITAYVEVIRNTPFLVQIFIVFFGLPFSGIRVSATMAAMIALSVNVGAYATEIIRAGIQSIPRGQMEAALALGLSRRQAFFDVILLPALRSVYPALTSQYILLMLQTSVASAISARELTSVANNIQAVTFVSFEVYLVTTAIYLTLTLGFYLIFQGLAAAAFRYPLQR